MNFISKFDYNQNLKYIIVGSGMFGSVIAERLTHILNEPVLIIERRSHVGGNSYSAIDLETGIEYHQYGSHIFHTSSEKVWKYITQFCDFTQYRHKVLISSQGQIYFMPINLKTLCDVSHKIVTPAEAQQILQSTQQDPGMARNLEEMAKTLIGPELYDKLIREYTIKQWGKEPKDLPANIITRLPVRTDFNIDYFNDPYQGVPADGYGKLFEKLLSDEKVQILLNTDFRQVRRGISPDVKIIYTGMIDELFDYQYGALEWRSLYFEKKMIPVQDFQGNAVINYADLNIPYTRIHEYKHYHPEWDKVFHSSKTLICKEYPQPWEPGKEAYYPVNTEKNQQRLLLYEQEAQKYPNLFIGGRLGKYRYLNMDQTISAALDCFNNQIMKRI